MNNILLVDNILIMEIDQKLKLEAIKWAEGIADQIIASAGDESKIKGEASHQYNILKGIGWFDKHPANAKNKASLVLTLSIGKYKALIWAKDHPPKKKFSKWEVVTGRKGEK